ncbi:MAG: hypothetical protein AAGJ83_06400, partial [Planctomycetota bacterium]
AFCDRRPIEPFVQVLADIQATEILANLRSMRERLSRQPGATLIEAEYWAARLDEWAEDLVPADDEQSEGRSEGSTKRSMPPQAILEVLRLLEAEVELREETRKTERAKSIMSDQDHMQSSIALSETQDLLRDRLDKVVDDLSSQPQGQLHFATEMEVLSAGVQAMADAAEMLVSRETGPPAIAAETEAIELLLQSRKINPEPSSSGSSLSSQTEGTDQAAMQLIEDALNPLAQQRVNETRTTTSRTREGIPERYRESVREFFERLDRRKTGRAEAPLESP